MVQLAAKRVYARARSGVCSQKLLVAFVALVSACRANELGTPNARIRLVSGVGTVDRDTSTGNHEGQPIGAAGGCRHGAPACTGARTSKIGIASAAADRTTIGDLHRSDSGLARDGAADSVAPCSSATSTSTSTARRQLATYPSSVTNGSVSATFPSAAFATWCASDSACAAAGDLTLSLLHHTSTSSFTSETLNWPNVFSGAGISSLQLVSGVVELQFGNYPAKLDQLICDSATSCTAQMAIPLSSADVTQSFVCLRLEPGVTGSGYQAYGFPPGSDGTSSDGVIVSGVLRCNTNRFGKHVIMQYKQSAVPPPPPPMQSPPPSPPPPPPLNTTGDTFKNDVKLRMSLWLSVGFDTLKSDAEFLSAMTASLESTLTTSLDTVVPELLLLPSETKSTGSIYKISRSDSSTKESVLVDIRLVVPAGATEAQILALMRLITTNTTYIFNGSPYTSYFMGSAKVSYVPTPAADYIDTGEAVGIALGAMVGSLLLIAGGYALYRWHAYTAILPKKPEGEWDATGVALVPRERGRRRRNLGIPGPDSGEGQPQQQQQQGGAGAQGGAGSGLAPPWDGASGPAGGAGGGIKSEAELVPSKEAWG